MAQAGPAGSTTGQHWEVRALLAGTPVRLAVGAKEGLGLPPYRKQTYWPNVLK